MHYILSDHVTCVSYKIAGIIQKLSSCVQDTPTHVNPYKKEIKCLHYSKKFFKFIQKKVKESNECSCNRLKVMHGYILKMCKYAKKINNILV